MLNWAYSVILSFGGESTLSGITEAFTESWRNPPDVHMKRLKKEACSEETAVAVAQAAVAPAFAQEELCREQTAVAVWRTAVAPIQQDENRGRGCMTAVAAWLFPEDPDFLPGFLSFYAFLIFS